MGSYATCAAKSVKAKKTPCCRQQGVFRLARDWTSGDLGEAFFALGIEHDRLRHIHPQRQAFAG